MAEQKEIWNLQDLFAGKTEQEILDRVLALKTSIVEKKPLFTSEVLPELVLELIKLNEELDFELSKITAYYSLISSADVNDQEANAKIDFYRQLDSDIDNETMFFDLWFIGLPKTKSKIYIDSEILKPYKKHLKDLVKLKPYTKSEEVEQILNIKNITGREAFSNLYDIFTSSFKYTFMGQTDLTQEELVAKRSDPDPAVRVEAYNSVLNVYKENSSSLHEIYKNVVLDWNNENIKIRKYKDAITPRNVANDLTQEVVEIMISVIRENVNLFQEYFKLKKTFLEKKGKPHDYSRFHIYAPYESDLKEYSFRVSKKITLDTFNDFDPEFYEFAKKIFDEKHIHSHPDKGKRNGAFCYGPNNKTTPYILLNHTNKLRDLFTMMHELGHGIHDLYSYRNPNLLHSPVLPLAETASILAETILSKKLLKTKNTEEKAAILMYLLENYYASIQRQTYFVIFEEIAHKKIMQGVTKKELDDEYYVLLKEQFGDMEIPEIFKHEWNYIPHIHHTPFYCYAYSWGNLLVLALYAEYEKNPQFKEKIKDILKAGGSEDTLEILQRAGINPTNKEFWEQGFNIIKEELKEFKKLIDSDKTK